MMKYGKLFSLLILITLNIYGALGFYFLPLAGFEGDQTRIGLLPEAQFGWTLAQPAIDPALLQQASWTEADVFVVGDSFSVVRVWQTELVRHGLKVRTEHWANVRGICEDFMPWLRSKGFKGKQIVLETVERNAASGYAESVACKKMHFRDTASADIAVAPPLTQVNRQEANYSGQLSIGLQTAWNTAKYQRLSAQQDFKRWDTERGSIVARVANGCELFSHPSCADALFLASDNPRPLDDAVIENMRQLNQRVAELNPIWVTVPNKTTAYLLPDNHFWVDAEAQLNAVNVLKLVRQAIGAKTVDVYPANNQHFSTPTYLLMGEEIYNVMQKTR